MANRLLDRKLANGALLSGSDNPAFEPDVAPRPFHATGSKLSLAGAKLSDEELDGKDDDTDDGGILGKKEKRDDDGLGDDDDDVVAGGSGGSSGAATVESESNASIGQDSRANDFEGLEEDSPDKNWDVFEETAWENLAHADRRFWSRVNAVSRVAICLVLFLLILFTSCLSSMTFLLIAYNINSAGDNFTLPGGQMLKRASDEVSVRWVWAAMMMTSAPYCFTLFSGLYKLCVKRTRHLKLKPLLLALTVEAVHSIGLGVFVFLVAPAYDPLMVLLLSQGTALVPAILRVFRVKRTAETDIPMEELRWNWLNFGVLVLTTVFLSLVGYKLYIDSIILPVAAPLSLALLSVVWWENFVPVKEMWKKSRRREIHRARRLKKKGRLLEAKEHDFESGSWLFRAKYAIRDRRTKIETMCAAWKIFLNFMIPIVIFAAKGGTDCVSALYYTSGFAPEGCSLWDDRLKSSVSGSSWCSKYLPFVVAGVGIGASGIAYKAAKVACKINAQRACFALPFLLTAPLTFIVALLTYRDPFLLHNCPLQWPQLEEGQSLLWLLGEYTRAYWLPIIFLGMLLEGLTTSHVWTPSAERVASTDKLFVRPLYCGVMFVQSMLFNRAADDNETAAGQAASSLAKQTENWTNRMENQTAESEQEVEEKMKDAKFPRIYACATMWHETKKEMTQLLKSLFRMDTDQFTRACMWKRFNVVDKDFYWYEAHIFFDDAFVKTKSDDDSQDAYLVNSYVKDLLSVVDDAVNAIYPDSVSMEPPKKMETPYGGRLTFELPGGNNLVVHLKNRDKIRHKKRWSQVMYMYYLLSYKLLLGKGNTADKRRLADNTFLLALDGDVDFYPDAVQLLVDRMRRNLHVGAACGRIHPIGSGLMVWYQRFEYAVSHWLQKATEHVFGCVLCSPGCFSLFRGSALMEDNVLKRYTKVADQAREAVQYDMGEDRWLCTLLLQQGKRVEYAAAADALTFCPDDFGDFYIQRRRWTPSTMANILDLLSDWRHVTKVNSSISLVFIAYQAFLFVSSLVTPGTIFLLVLGAINTAYPSLPLYAAMLLNLLPIIVFIILCFTAKTQVQIAYATILSTVYSLVMMVVLVGLLRQVAESGMCSVTAIFFVGVASVFVLAALIHPQESGNLLFGLLYFLAIPSTSMLLTFFAVANLNVVSWGTRDSSAPKAKSTLGGALQGRVRRILSGVDNSGDDAVTSDYTFSFGNLFRCICCPTKKSADPTTERLGDIENALYELRQAVMDRRLGGSPPRGRDVVSMHLDSASPGQQFEELPIGDRQTRNPLFNEDDFDEVDTGGRKRESGFPMRWFEEEEMGSGTLGSLPHEESRFWTELIEKYLLPIPPNPDKERAMTSDLTKLRNKAAMLFFLGNALFVTIIFILESVSEYSPGLTFELPCDKGHAGQKIEPISVTFTVVFGILLILQLFGMLLHRFSTFVHIVAATSLRRREGGAESENFALHKRDYFYALTNHFVKPFADPDAQTETSSRWDDGSSTGGTLLSSDTQSLSGYGRQDLVKKLVRRQTTKPGQGHRNLQNVTDDKMTGFISEVKKIRPRRDEEDEGGSESGGGNDVVIPPKLRWLKGHSMKAVMSLAQDPGRLKIVENRIEAKANWQKLFKRVTDTTDGRPAGMADIVLQMRERKFSAANGDNLDAVKKGPARKTSVAFGVSTGPGGIFPKSVDTSFGEKPTTSGSVGDLEQHLKSSESSAPLSRSNWVKAWMAGGNRQATLSSEADTELKVLANVHRPHDAGVSGASAQSGSAGHMTDDVYRASHDSISFRAGLSSEGVSTKSSESGSERGSEVQTYM